MPETDGRRRERGQILVLFTLALIAMMAMVGLVLDGGSAFVQRRNMQNVADAAAMAAGYAYANTGLTAAAVIAAQGVAIKNGYTPGVNGVTMNVTSAPYGAGALTFRADISKPHQNTFAGVVGQSTWTVSTTASAITGAPNVAQGVMPLIFNQKVNETPLNTEVTFDEPGTGTEDVPQDAVTFNWTVFCIASGGGTGGCNGDSSTVDDIINGIAPTAETTVSLDDEIGPLNAGSHTTLFSDLSAHIGDEAPVAIVDDEGGLVGIAMFHLTGSVGGTTKQISGYFVGPMSPEAMTIDPSGPAGSSAWGSYVVKLTN